MSAWSVGAVPKAAIHAEDATQPTGLKTFVDKVVAWIPGDVLGLYLAAVSAIGVAKPQLWLLIVAVLLAPAVVLLGAQTLSKAERPNKVPLRAVLAAAATAIWTLTVPGSGWQVFSVIADNAPAVAVIAAIAGLLFGLAAEVAVK